VYKFLTLWEEEALRFFSNRVLRKMFDLGGKKLQTLQKIA
jgi:hypothetical protein